MRTGVYEGLIRTSATLTHVGAVSSSTDPLELAKAHGARFGWILGRRPGTCSVLIGALMLRSMYQERQAAAQTGGPATIALGQRWSGVYQNRAVTIDNVNGVYALTIYSAPAGGTAIFQGAYGSPQDAWNQAMASINTLPATAPVAVAAT
jgi:hypothetical protein